MAVTVSANLTTLWDCESTTGAVGNKPALESEIIKEGSYSVDFTMSTVGSNNLMGFERWEDVRDITLHDNRALLLVEEGVFVVVLHQSEEE